MWRMSLLPGIFTVCVSHCMASSVLLCGGPEVIEANVVKAASGTELKQVWHWRPEESEGLPVPMMRKFITTDDCKAVSHGEEILITSSGDAVALVSHRDGKTLFYARVRNAHSAALLPGGWIAVAASSDDGIGEGNRIVLFDRKQSDKPIMFLPLWAAHGVEWDDRRNVLWALGGDKLQKLTLDVEGQPKLVLQKEVDLPAKEGHDLQLAEDRSVLYVTNTKNVFQVDPEKLTFSLFEPFAGKHNIKSISFEQGTGRIAYTQAETGVWWTYHLHFLKPEDTVTLPAMIYKVRWYEPSR